MGIKKIKGARLSSALLNFNHKKFYQFCRWLHIYSSTALFAILILFCVSGLILNHVDWLANDKTNGELKQPLPNVIAEQLQSHPEQAATVLTTYLNQQFNLPQPKSIERDQGDILLDYPLPAGFAYVVVTPKENSLILEYQIGGFWSVIGDLHKGRYTGGIWAWVIDLSAILICLFGITGIIILIQNRKKRRSGMWSTIIGILTPWAIYLLFIPRLSGVS